MWNRKCGTRESTVLERANAQQRRIQFVAKNKHRAIVRPKLHVPIVYHVLHSATHGGSNVSLEHIREQHRVINRDFNLRNNDAGKVPVQGNYAFSDDRGSADIIFDPEDHLQVSEGFQIIRIQTNRIFNGGLGEIIDSGVSPRHPGKLNCYIAPLPESLAGQAELESNILVISFQTVGSDLLQGTGSTSFAQGRSLTHEIGHSFGLNHPFGQGCVENRLILDIPTTHLPNFQAQLFYNAKVSGWDGYLDNRDREERLGEVGSNVALACQDRPYTCASENGKYEMFMNYMDYSTDEHAVMFSRGQCDAMYAFVDEVRTTGQGGGNLLLNVTVHAGRIEDPAPPYPAPDNSSGTRPPDPETPWDINSCNSGGSSTNIITAMPWWLWIVLGLIILTSISLSLYNRQRRRRRSNLLENRKILMVENV